MRLCLNKKKKTFAIVPSSYDHASYSDAGFASFKKINKYIFSYIYQ